MRRAIQSSVRDEVIRLRNVKRKSLLEISQQLGIAKSTASRWLKDYPLTVDELRKRLSANSRNSWKRKEVADARKKRPIHFAPNTSAPLFTAGKDARRMRWAAIGTAINWFMSRNYIPSIPVVDGSYDLVVESETGMQRVQIKTAEKKNQNGTWSLKTARRVYDSSVKLNSSGRYRYRPYVEGELDVFFFLTGDGDIYLIPFSAIAGKLSVSVGIGFADFKQLP